MELSTTSKVQDMSGDKLTREEAIALCDRYKLTNLHQHQGQWVARFKTVPVLVQTFAEQMPKCVDRDRF